VLLRFVEKNVLDGLCRQPLYGPEERLDLGDEAMAVSDFDPQRRPPSARTPKRDWCWLRATRPGSSITTSAAHAGFSVRPVCGRTSALV
jgi:hypothetical protein